MQLLSCVVFITLFGGLLHGCGDDDIGEFDPFRSPYGDPPSGVSCAEDTYLVGQRCLSRDASIDASTGATGDAAADAALVSLPASSLCDADLCSAPSTP